MLEIMEPDRTLTVRGLSPLPAHDNHDTNNMKAFLQRLQPNYLTCYKQTSQMTISNRQHHIKIRRRLNVKDY
jgi:hypothetical protein